jgi:putative flavoprotein involved in K+ transport
VLERGEVGHTWRTQRWDSFTLNTPNWMRVLPESAYAGSAPDAFATSAEWIEQLERYVRDRSLPVRTHAEVTAVEPDGSGAFAISTATGDRIVALNIIVAAGVQNAPKLPPVARDIDPKTERLTTAEYRRPAQLPPGAVLIVGSAQSGCQIAEDLLAAGREVFLSTGNVGRVPRRLRGRDTFAWLEEVGWFRQRPQDLPDPSMVRWAQPQTSGNGPRGHTVSYQSLAARGVTLLGHFEGAAGARLSFGDDLPAHIRFADDFAERIRKTVDDHIARRDDEHPATEPDPADAPVLDLSRYDGRTTLDLAARVIRSVIFSVGFGADLSWLHVPVLDDRGAPIHTEGRAPVDGVWFVGLPWMRTRKSGILWGAAEDSAHVVDQIVARLNRRSA